MPSRFNLYNLGENISENNVEKQGKNVTNVSNNSLDLTNLAEADLEIRGKIMAHGMLMVACWIVLIPNGIFISRYFKESYTSSICMDRKLWYFYHGSFMLGGFLLFLIAILIVLITQQETGTRWSTVHSSHAKYGGITAMFFSLQILGGLYRPTGVKEKKTFSILHFFMGNITYFFGMNNVFKSHYLGMPCEIVLYAIVAITWLILCHFLMAYHFFWLDTNLALKKVRALRPFPIEVVLFEDAPGTKQRVRIILIHFIGSVIIGCGISIDFSLRYGTCIEKSS